MIRNKFFTSIFNLFITGFFINISISICNESSANTSINLQANEWFSSAPQSNIIHLGRYHEQILFTDKIGNSDNITDDYRIFPFYLDKDTRISVDLYDNSQNKAGNLVKEKKLQKGSYFFVISYNDIFEKLNSTGTFTIKLEENTGKNTKLILAEFNGLLKKYVSGKLFGKIIYNGVFIENGEISLSYHDIETKGRGPDLNFSRFFSGHAHDREISSTLGSGWHHSLDIYMRTIAYGETANFNIPKWVAQSKGVFKNFDSLVYSTPTPNYIFLSNGGHFKKSNGKWVPKMGYHGSISENDNEIIFYSKDRTEYHFNKPHNIKIQNPAYWFHNKNTTPPEGLHTRYGRMNNTYVNKIVDRNSNTLNFSYRATPFGPLLIKATDAVNRILEFKYIKLSGVFTPEAMPYRITMVTGPENARIEYNYDHEGHLTGYKRDYNHEKYLYSTINLTLTGERVKNMRKIFDANNNATDYQYFKPDQLPDYFSNLYPGINNLSVVNHIFYPENSSRQFTYGKNNIYNRSTYDGNGFKTEYTLSRNGNPNKIRTPSGNISKKIWGPAENVYDLVEIERTEDETNIHYKYNTRGNIIKETTFKKQIVRDSNNVIIREVEFESDEILSKWNKFSFLIERRWPDSPPYLAEHDASGNMTRQLSSNEVNSTFTYNQYGEVIKKIINNETAIIYGYDQWGLKSKTSGTDSITATYEHDARGRLIRETKLPGKTNTYQYDQLDKLIFKNNNGLITKYEYDNIGDLIKRESVDGNVITYLRDRRGRLLISKSTAGWYHKLSYDRNGNNTAEQSNNDVIRRFQYDMEDNELFPPLSINHEGSPYQQGH
ncbi:MAG TPA: RHS repeat protein [Gammaproteobacteria bacterium]|nr:RHS repeat protein [Gammaproteobacteria bacterium]